MSSCLLALVGCSSMVVQSDHDPTVSFSGFKTYDWISEPRKPTGDPRIDQNPLLDARIREAVDRVLATKGLSKATSGQPDLLLAYHVTLNRRTEVVAVNNAYGYSPGWGWPPGYPYGPYIPPGPPQTMVRQYDQGSLILDMVLPGTRRLVWRGIATDEVSFAASPERRREKLDEAVRRMLEKFPPS